MVQSLDRDQVRLFMQMQMPRARRQRAAYTLIEVLIVCAILGAIGGLAAVSIPRMLNRHALDEAMAELAWNGRWLRAAAEGHGITLRLSSTGWEIVKNSSASARATESLVNDLRVNDACRIAWMSADKRRSETLVIDRYGRSDDRVVVIDGPGGSRRLRWLGISGQWQTEP